MRRMNGVFDRRDLKNLHIRENNGIINKNSGIFLKQALCMKDGLESGDFLSPDFLLV